MGDKYKVFDDLLEGVQVINKKWQYVYVNHALANHGKTTKEQLLGKTMMEVYPGIENTKMFSVLKKCMLKQISERLINEFDFPDGSKGYFELRMQPVPEGVLILSVDITQEKRLEIELQNLNKHLENKVDARTKELIRALDKEKELNVLKSRFVSIASHEFKTPLGAIQISVNVLEDYNDPIPEYTEQRREMYGYIKSSVKSMFEILDEYLILDKIENHQINSNHQIFNYKELISSEIERMKIICKENQKINYNHSGLVSIKTDKQLVKSIFTNLLSNAIKYSAADVEVNSEITKKYIELSVTDKGIGVPAKDRKKIFQKFYRATNTTGIQGTGLGLIIVKKYVDLLDGKIDFKSELNKGTTFQIKIPVQTFS